MRSSALLPALGAAPLVVGVDLDAGRLVVRVVDADVLDEPPVARAARVGHDHAVVGRLLHAHTHQADLDCHRSNCSFSGWPARPGGSAVPVVPPRPGTECRVLTPEDLRRGSVPAGSWGEGPTWTLPVRHYG